MKLGLLEVDIPGLVENCIGFVRSAEASNIVGVNTIYFWLVVSAPP